MDNLFFGSFIDSNSPGWGFSAIINGLVDVETTYNIIYDAIIQHPSYVIFSKSDSDHKVKVLTKMIKHYEELEEYEKCANLLKIKKIILE